MFRNAVSLFKFSDFNIRIDPSWFLIAALILWSQSFTYFPSQTPGQALFTGIALSVVAMLRLCASLLIQDLPRSFMAQKFRLDVHKITLLVFGDAAELEANLTGRTALNLDSSAYTRPVLRNRTKEILS